MEDYSQDGEAQIAETTTHGRRLIVRRTRLIGPQAELWPDWRYFPFITNRTEALKIVEAEHRQHAVVELTIRDLKDQALAHFPSGQFNANSAWTVIACIAHNLLRWTSAIGLAGETVRVARTMRRRLLQIPGRLTHTGRLWTLHLPARWPWQHDFTRALARIRALPELTRAQTATTEDQPSHQPSRPAHRCPKARPPKPPRRRPPPLTPTNTNKTPENHANPINHRHQTITRWIQAYILLACFSHLRRFFLLCL